MPATPVQTLADASSCFTCLGVSAPESFQLALWDLISQRAAVDPIADFVSRAGLVDQTQIDAVTALYAAGVANGWMAKCDLVYPFVGGNALAHSQNLKSSSYTITWVGTVTHDANGITGNGTDGYGNTGYNPGLGALWSLNSAHVGIYRRNAGTNNRYYAGSSDAAGHAVLFFKGAIGTQLRGAINTLTNPSTFNAATFAWSVSTRLDAANQHIYHAGADNSFVVASTGVPSFPLFVLALNSQSIPALFNTANMAGMTAGSGLTFAEYTAMAADWQAFNTSLGRQV